MTEYKFTANYQPIEEQHIVILFDEIHEQLYNKGWTAHWEFNSTIDPALLKYNDCVSYLDCREIDANVYKDVDAGAWNYYLDNLVTSGVYYKESNKTIKDGLFMNGNGNTSNSSLLSFNANLPNLTDGTCMFYYCGGLTSWDIDLPNLTNGSNMFFQCLNLASFSGALPKLTNAYWMFWSCKKLTSWTVDLPNLTYGDSMFYACTGLTQWTIPLPNLTDGGLMFYRCTGLTSWTIPLPNLTYGSNMFSSCTGLTSFSVDLPNLIDGQSMFKSCTNLTSFSGALPKLSDASFMFLECKKLASWTVDLPNLTDGFGMFDTCTKLASWTVNLPNLTDGRNMFNTCTGLTKFSGALPNLEIGGYSSGGMFEGCSNLTSWTVALPKLTNGSRMFYGCTKFTSFSVDLSKMTNGFGMFYGCTGLTSFSSNLSSLTNGYFMFGGPNETCTRLDTASVQNIANTINNLTDKTPDGTTGWGQIYIGIGNKTPNAKEETAFNTMVSSKGWTVYVNGSSDSDIWTPTASTNLTDEEESTSIPFYAKPIEVAEEHADYTSSDGKFYIIVGAQFIYGDDLSTYGMFTSFEHAESEIMSYLNLTKIEKTDEKPIE